MLIFPGQSGFKPVDSSINQLTSITHEIYKFFDDGLVVWGAFLDISKAFDNVWCKGLLYILKQIGISGKLFDIITDFLNFRKPRVVLNGKYSSWTSIEARVPQGSMLAPVFLIYIYDLSDDLTANAKPFADDTSLFYVVHNMKTSTINLNNDPSKQAQEVISSRKL